MTVAEEGEVEARTLAFDLADGVPPLVAVRRWAGEALSDLGDDDVTDCVLVVTELVTNAYDHGAAPRRVALHRDQDPCRIRVEVHDGSRGRVRVGRSRLGGHRGRGMVIVSQIAAEWGVRQQGAGKTVWAEIVCQATDRTG
ncbi:ATP-binding protein [Saccharothrix longispora]|uniref:ATP-binding protein n=1 Tax=Saccharothrix longispora TaxID=33920 RepID=UPI0028FD133C|nr:ATP-binding protein [Saccharothrix longispora]MDU0288881.1 ATP-binding protein [Saccharothrix longispora]